MRMNTKARAVLFVSTDYPVCNLPLPCSTESRTVTKVIVFLLAGTCEHLQEPHNSPVVFNSKNGACLCFFGFHSLHLSLIPGSFTSASPFYL